MRVTLEQLNTQLVPVFAFLKDLKDYYRLDPVSKSINRHNKKRGRHGKD